MSKVAVRAVVTFLLLVVFSSVLFAGGRQEDPGIDAKFFYMEICSACETYQLADLLSGLLVSASRKYGNVTAKGYNVAAPQNSDVLRETIEERGLPDIAYLSPVLIVNSIYIIGYEEIEVAVQELYDTGDLALLHTTAVP